jgi:hypothetical protein
MQHLKTFVLSQGARYQELQLASQDLQPRGIPEAKADGLDGWSFLMRTPARDFALAYFENRALATTLRGFEPSTIYQWTWFDPRNGSWAKAVTVTADGEGVLAQPIFPSGKESAAADFAAKILLAR